MWYGLGHRSSASRDRQRPEREQNHTGRAVSHVGEASPLLVLSDKHLRRTGSRGWRVRANYWLRNPSSPGGLPEVDAAPRRNDASSPNSDPPRSTLAVFGAARLTKSKNATVRRIALLLVGRSTVGVVRRVARWRARAWAAAMSKGRRLAVRDSAPRFPCRLPGADETNTALQRGLLAHHPFDHRTERLLSPPSVGKDGPDQCLPARRQALIRRSVHAVRSAREAREATTPRELHPQSVLESGQALVTTLGVREPLAPIGDVVRAARCECFRPWWQE
jgi:hypothetical protein